MSDFKQSLIRANTPIIANALELGAAAIMGIAGNGISNHVEGREITPAFLQSALGRSLKHNLLHKNPQPSQTRS